MLRIGMMVCLITMGFLASCGKEESDKNPKEDERNYTETAFSIGMRMVFVEGGTFEMGGTEEQGDDAYPDEKPIRTVRLDSYYIGKYEVTQAQWCTVMGTTLEEQKDKAYPESDNYYGKGDNYPMYYVSWEEAQEFCNRLSEQTGKKYVLPTEEMWEYAARGGVHKTVTKYAGSNDIDEVAWYYANSYFGPDCGTHRVGTKKANALGIYDMSGNVWEWCSDKLGHATFGSICEVRGGGWCHGDRDCRVSRSCAYDYGRRDSELGFRVAVLP